MMCFPSTIWVLGGVGKLVPGIMEVENHQLTSCLVFGFQGPSSAPVPAASPRNAGDASGSFQGIGTEVVAKSSKTI